MRKQPTRFQKQGKGLLPSVTFTRYRLNAYDTRTVPESLRAVIRLATSANVWRFRTCGSLYLYDTLPQRLPQHLEHMAAELRQFIPEEYAVVGQRHFTRHRHMTATDQPHIGDRVMRSTTRARRGL
jgi:hypothetical protein